MAKKISRRTFLVLTGSTLGSGILAACSTPAAPAPVATTVPAKATAVPPAAPTAAKTAGFNESPMLAELVKAGKLPAVQDRLPTNPKVADGYLPEHLKAVVGRYGGTLRLIGPSKQYSHDGHIGLNWQGLTYPPSVEGDPMTEGVADYQASPDDKVFTFRLRQGQKWSDGKPVTTKDVQFALEDVRMNAELTPAGFPAWLRSGNRAAAEPMKLEIVDDRTFKISFAEPYGGFPTMAGATGWRSYHELLLPRHYLEQFHKKYADPAKLDALIKENKFETWVQLFQYKNPPHSQYMGQASIPLPKLTAWLTKEASDELCVLERNPYYWKVDAAGNQLPYIDRVEYRTVADPQVLSLKLMAGEADHCRQDVTISQVALLKENEAKGGYKVYLGKMHVVQVCVMLNLTHKDENWRKVVRDIRFRKALSLAFNRKEFISAVWYGLAELPTIQDATYDPAAAQKMLDEMGLDKKDSDGFRLGPDGKTFTILLEYMSNQIDFPQSGPLVAQYFNAVGIKTTAKGIDGALWSQRNVANELQATFLWDTSPLWYYMDHGMGSAAPLWLRWWNTGGKEGEEPPAEIKTYFEKLYWALTAKPVAWRKLHDEAYKLFGENYWAIIPAKNLRQPYISNAKLGNMEISESAIAFATTHAMEQWFYKA
jgi:peptide/nickel transport system substrate-binding protein